MRFASPDAIPPAPGIRGGKEWQSWAAELKEVLDLRGNPVAITYATEPAENGGTPPRRLWACHAFQAARDGEVVNLTVGSSGCPSATAHLGLADVPKSHLDAIADSVVQGEKLVASRAVLYRSLGHTDLPVGIGSVIVLSPLAKAQYTPDVVLFICNPLQASRLVTLANFEVGDSLNVRLSDPTCLSAVATPLQTGKVSVSLIDVSSRGICKYEADEMIVTIPFHLMHGVMRNMDKSSAGTAPVEWSGRMRAIKA